MVKETMFLVRYWRNIKRGYSRIALVCLVMMCLERESWSC